MEYKTTMSAKIVLDEALLKLNKEPIKRVITLANFVYGSPEMYIQNIKDTDLDILSIRSGYQVSTLGMKIDKTCKRDIAMTSLDCFDQSLDPNIVIRESIRLNRYIFNQPDLNEHYVKEVSKSVAISEFSAKRTSISHIITTKFLGHDMNIHITETSIDRVGYIIDMYIPEDMNDKKYIMLVNQFHTFGKLFNNRK